MLAAASLGACRPDGESTAPGSGEEEAAAAPDGPIEVPILPPPMAGTYVPAGDTSSGRILIVSLDMLAAVECADCGLPVYASLESIACGEDQVCEVSTEECKGTITPTKDRGLVVALEPAEACARYSGEFVRGEMVGTQGEVIAAGENRPRVVVGEIRSPRALDIEAARAAVDRDIGRLDACYATALAKTPRLTGEIVLEVVHGARADKRPAHIKRRTIDDEELVACIRDAFDAWDLPVAEDGLPAPVYYTLSFVLE